MSGGLINLSQIPLIVLLTAVNTDTQTMNAMRIAMKIMRNGGFSRKSKVYQTQLMQTVIRLWKKRQLNLLYLWLIMITTS